MVCLQTRGYSRYKGVTEGKKNRAQYLSKRKALVFTHEIFKWDTYPFSPKASVEGLVLTSQDIILITVFSVRGVPSRLSVCTSRGTTPVNRCSLLFDDCWHLHRKASHIHESLESIAAFVWSRLTKAAAALLCRKTNAHHPRLTVNETSGVLLDRRPSRRRVK